MKWSTLGTGADIDGLQRVQSLHRRGGLLGCGLLGLLVHAHLTELLCHTGNTPLHHGRAWLTRIGGIGRLISSGSSAIGRLTVWLLRSLSSAITVARLLVAHWLLAIAVAGGLASCCCWRCRIGTTSRGLASIGTGTKVEGLAGVCALLLGCATSRRGSGGALLIIVRLRCSCVLLSRVLGILGGVLVSLGRVPWLVASHVCSAVLCCAVLYWLSTLTNEGYKCRERK